MSVRVRVCHTGQKATRQHVNFFFRPEPTVDTSAVYAAGRASPAGTNAVRCNATPALTPDQGIMCLVGLAAGWRLVALPRPCPPHSMSAWAGSGASQHLLGMGPVRLMMSTPSSGSQPTRAQTVTDGRTALTAETEAEGTPHEHQTRVPPCITAPRVDPKPLRLCEHACPPCHRQGQPQDMGTSDPSGAVACSAVANALAVALAVGYGTLKQGVVRGQRFTRCPKAHTRTAALWRRHRSREPRCTSPTRRRAHRSAPSHNHSVSRPCWPHRRCLLPTARCPPTTCPVKRSLMQTPPQNNYHANASPG